MPDYQKLYATMFNAATDALEELGHFNVGRARDILRTAQQRAEALYIAGDGDEESRAEEAAEDGDGSAAI